jgi:hypothetical protein
VTSPSTWHKCKWHLLSLFHSGQWYQATIPMTEWFVAKEWWGKQRVITLNITYFWTVPYLQVFQTPCGNQICFCHPTSGKVSMQLGVFKRATDLVPKMCLKKPIQYTLSSVYCNTAPCKTLSLIWSNKFYLWWYIDPNQFQTSAIQIHVTYTLSGQVQGKRQLHKVMIINGLNF